MAAGIIYDGFPSMEEIKEANGWPDEERFLKGPVAVVECVQQIPCNPCESACPFHAIHIGEPITNTPKVDKETCIGCGMCVAACPGLAIFLVDKSYSETEATVSFPFEYDPLPEPGAEVDALSRGGEYVLQGSCRQSDESEEKRSHTGYHTGDSKGIRRHCPDDEKIEASERT